VLRLQGFYRAYAGITLPNSGSVGLHEAMGFQPVGAYRAVGFKEGAWHDVGWWQLELQPLISAPVLPKSFHHVREAPQWHTALQAGVSMLRR
jgi:hypothetical protein